VKTIWKGAISFGLVTIPVRVYGATEAKSLRFNQLHEPDGGRIRYKRVCSVDGEEIDYSEIVKGYEYEKDHYVTLTDEELDSLPVASAKAIEIERFVEAEEIDAGLRDRILESAAGNPLFVEEMVAMIAEHDRPDVTVPPTIHALLAARLDQLDTAERSVLERGSVEGQVFHRGAVVALAPEETPVDGRLVSLIRKDLVRPERPVVAYDEAFRFRHLLIRDTAYDGLPKAVRAELHERFAAWLVAHARRLPPRSGLPLPGRARPARRRRAAARRARGRASARQQRARRRPRRQRSGHRPARQGRRAASGRQPRAARGAGRAGSRPDVAR